MLVADDTYIYIQSSFLINLKRRSKQPRAYTHSKTPGIYLHFSTAAEASGFSDCIDSQPSSHRLRGRFFSITNLLPLLEIHWIQLHLADGSRETTSHAFAYWRLGYLRVWFIEGETAVDVRVHVLNSG